MLLFSFAFILFVGYYAFRFASFEETISFEARGSVGKFLEDRPLLKFFEAFLFWDLKQFG